MKTRYLVLCSAIAIALSSFGCYYRERESRHAVRVEERREERREERGERRR